VFNRDRLVKSHVRTRFLVTLKTGEAFEGLLYDADGRTLDFADAWAVDTNARRQVDGHLFIARADIAYMQIPHVVVAAAAEIAQ
jgi:hypothetical protein